MVQVGKRQAHKQRTRQALEDAAWALFAEQGYDQTPVAAIAGRVGVSERTFYRYFEQKEAVLFGDWHVHLDDFVAFVEGRPHDEPVVRTLREFSQGWALANQAGLARSRERRAIVKGSQRVRDYERTRVLDVMRQRITQTLAVRMGVDAHVDVRPTILAGLLIEILSAAKATWLDHGGHLVHRVRQAWSALSELSGDDVLGT